MNIAELKQQLKDLGAVIRQEQVDSPFNSEISNPVYLRVMQNKAGNYYDDPARILLLEMDPSELSSNDGKFNVVLYNQLESYFKNIELEDGNWWVGERWNLQAPDMVIDTQLENIADKWIIKESIPLHENDIPTLAIVECNGTVTYYKQVLKPRDTSKKYELVTREVANA